MQSVRGVSTGQQCQSSSFGVYTQLIVRKIHDKLLDVVLKGSIRFFTVTPVGRIINRFSKDIETIDGSLNGSLRVVITFIASLIGAVVSVKPTENCTVDIVDYGCYRCSVVLAACDYHQLHVLAIFRPVSSSRSKCASTRGHAAVSNLVSIRRADLCTANRKLWLR